MLTLIRAFSGAMMKKAATKSKIAAESGKK